MGMNVDPATLDAHSVAKYTNPPPHQSVRRVPAAIIPDSVVGAFARGDILPVLLFAVLFGLALAGSASVARPCCRVLEEASAALFGVIKIIMRVAPLGVFGAMASPSANTASARWPIWST